MDIDFSDKISALEVDKIYYQDTRKELSDQDDHVKLVEDLLKEVNEAVGKCCILVFAIFLFF